MKTFYITIEVIPTPSNEHFDLIKSALACCWILENDPQSAFAKAEFYVSRYDFKIKEVDVPPVVSVHPPPGSAGVSPAEMAAKMAALPAKGRGE